MVLSLLESVVKGARASVGREGVSGKNNDKSTDEKKAGASPLGTQITLRECADLLRQGQKDFVRDIQAVTDTTMEKMKGFPEREYKRVLQAPSAVLGVKGLDND